MTVSLIDHVAVPIQNVEAMLAFYELFGFRVDRTLAPNLYAVQCVYQKLNFHAPELWKNERFSLRGPSAKPGCGDFCFVWVGGLEKLNLLLQQNSIPIEEGPVQREGGSGFGTSTYVRDPDGNLVEFISYLEKDKHQ
ncbi:MAG: VOC family protein [Gammaproteobacteria bacterium]|nr:VOC family protein [Gammaproteobacteria bacterium]